MKSISEELVFKKTECSLIQQLNSLLNTLSLFPKLGEHNQYFQYLANPGRV